MNSVMTERLSLLLDSGSFCLSGEYDDGELVGGTGTIEGRRVCIIAINPKAVRQIDPFDILQQELALLDLAEKERIPLIHLADRPGRVAMETTGIPFAILRTFIDPRGAGRVFARFAHLSGIVPRIAVVFSPIATTLTYPVAECEAVVMVEQAGMSLARPDMVKLMTGDKSSYDEYGGARMHAEISGTCDMLAVSEREALHWVRRYIGYFPASFMDRPPCVQPTEPVRCPAHGTFRVPDDPNQLFDTHRLLEVFVDEDSLLEHRALYAGELITAFARVAGMPCGIIANNSQVRGGILFPESSRKLAAFASLCDAFSVPLVFLADLPGFMVGKNAEQAGVIQNGSLIFSTLANLSVPHLCIIMRKAYTAGFYAMGGAGFDPDRILALPTADITIYGEKALDMLADDQQVSAEIRENVKTYSHDTVRIGNYRESGYLDAIITQDEIRVNVEAFLRRAYGKPASSDRPRRILCI
ncbi:MAG: carboxyl transferase domain-containing protein [Methanoregula sp.]